MTQRFKFKKQTEKLYVIKQKDLLTITTADSFLAIRINSLNNYDMTAPS